MGTYGIKYFLFLVILLASNTHALNILATGQSNMCGRGVGGPSALLADPRVMVWNNTNELGNDGTQFISVPDFGNPPWHYSGANNLALWFADAAAQELNEDIKLVVVCKGDTSVVDWAAGGTMYNEIRAVYALTNLPPADVLLWHQGGSDAGMDPTYYKYMFMSAIHGLTIDSLIATDAVVIVGGNRSSAAAAINDALKGMAERHDYIMYTQQGGLNDFDGRHFTGQSLYDFGLRYWANYQ